jgi:hypothetical protein
MATGCGWLECTHLNPYFLLSKPVFPKLKTFAFPFQVLCPISIPLSQFYQTQLTRKWWNHIMIKLYV